MEKLTRDEYVVYLLEVPHTLLHYVTHTLRRSVLEPRAKPSHMKATSNYANNLELLETIFIKPARIFPV